LTRPRTLPRTPSGKAKEVVGDVTNNDELAAEGKKDQGVSGVKKVGENIKDTFHE
jgi:uncharacterized protein YjbJ (UPF0337 family)